MQSIVSKCIEQLLDLIDHVENAGMKNGQEEVDKEKLQLRRVVMK